MKSKLALSSALAMALACAATSQEPQPGLRLTEDQLLRQLDTFSPQSGDPLTKAPASVSETRAPAAADNANAKKPKGATEINADAVDFDQKSHQAIFTGRVVVKDPEFDLSCDKLTAFLKNEKADAPAESPTPAPKPGAAPKKKSGGLERAVAEGHVVISQDKLDSDGKVSKSIGRAARADYSATTGEMILSGNPEVEQGINTCVATDPSTRMYMKRDGKMRVDGPSKMIIRDQGGSK